MAARLLGVTPRRLRQLSDEGWFKPASRNEWSLIGVVRGHIEYMEDRIQKASKTASSTRLQDARAKEVELRIAQKDRTVIDLSEAQDATDKMAGIYLHSITGLPARITRNTSERKRIELICDKERTRLVERFAEIGESIQTGEDAADASLQEE